MENRYQPQWRSAMMVLEACMAKKIGKKEIRPMAASKYTRALLTSTATSSSTFQLSTIWSMSFRKMPFMVIRLLS